MKNLQIFLILSLLIGNLQMKAQNNGLLLDDETYEQTPTVPKSPERGKIKPKIDLRPYCPPPGDQGNLPSCVAWTLANAMTIQEAMDKQERSASRIEEMRFSVSYVYNQIKHQGICENGAYLSHGLRLLKTKGNCPASMLSYTLDCNPMPGRKHHSKARANRIKNYYKVFSKADPKEEKLDNILDELNLYRPVIVALKVPNNFRYFIPELDANWPAEANHAMLIVGYNDYNKTFLLMNSYGHTWGDNGFFEMSYNTLKEQVRYGYVIVK